MELVSLTVQGYPLAAGTHDRNLVLCSQAVLVFRVQWIQIYTVKENGLAAQPMFSMHQEAESYWLCKNTGHVMCISAMMSTVVANLHSMAWCRTVALMARTLSYDVFLSPNQTRHVLPNVMAYLGMAPNPWYSMMKCNCKTHRLYNLKERNSVRRHLRIVIEMSTQFTPGS